MPAVSGLLADVRSAFAGLPIPASVLDDARLLVSELVANSVRPARIGPNASRGFKPSRSARPRSAASIGSAVNGSTPASVLLDERISLASDGLTVIGLARAAGTLWLTIVRSDNPGEGSITLVFDEQPLALTQWQVTDAQGIITTVSWIGPQFGVKLNRKLFDFTDPRQPSRESP